MRAFVSSLCLSCALAGNPAWADLYALVIGIDEYEHIRDLDGAVNDAADIADAVRALNPKELRVLLNAEATRAAIYENWEELAAKAGAGDTFLITYAGHGGSEPAAYPGDEENNRDENLQLGGFFPKGEAAGERIRDDEIAALVALSPNANVVFVADSCHAGSVFRQATGRARYNPVDEIVDDPLPLPPRPNLPEHATGDQNIFFGAVPETELVHEITEGLQARGALSLAFAAGLRGAADADTDGVIRKGELEEYVLRTVHRRTDGGQFPVVQPLGVIDKPLFDLNGNQKQETNENPFATRFDDLPRVPLEITGLLEVSPLFTALTGVEKTTAPSERLKWDVPSQIIFSPRGEMLARLELEPGSPAISQISRVQAVMNKMRVARHLRQNGLERDLSLTFGSGYGIYRKGAEIKMNLEERKFDHPVLFNLASNGKIQFIYPDPKFSDRPRVPSRIPLNLTIYADEPFGADHLVAIETNNEVKPLLRAVRNRHRDTDNIRALWEDLHYALKDLELEFAIFPYFTKGSG